MRLSTVSTLFAPLAVAAVLAAPASASAAPAPTCRPTDPTQAQVRLTTADDGRSLCLVTGQRISVTLSVDPQRFPDPANWWTPITASGAALEKLPNTVLPVRGTTLASFLAVQPGSATVTSTWSICPAGPGQPPCGAPVRLWRVTAQVTDRY